MIYDPESETSRRNLATAIQAKLIECKFQQEHTSPNNELTFVLPVKDTGMIVKVYTSIVDDQVRTVGADAIRVAGLFEHGDDVKGITSEKRINRVGEIPEIVGRMYERMRSVYAGCNKAERCKSCGAPKFQSKAGNMVCAAICWRKE